MSLQNSLKVLPFIGAEIFIEPGQTRDEIEGWFRIMKENGMELTRIRMFESYLHKPDGSWDFSLFDQAFKAGETYGIKIYANLFPATVFTDVGGFKFPDSAANLQSIAEYIRHVVVHFSQFNSLYGWVPINEPGNSIVPEDTFTQAFFREWKNNQPKAIYQSNGYPTFDFAEERFLVDYNIWFLRWLVAEIRKYDPERPVHVNNHNIFHNAAEYDFPVWRTFLTSLGGSAHASWHFTYFTRRQYALAVNANSEILRSGAGPIPWLMTELQGGNNTYSSFHPLCPTREEIAQWLWTTLFTGSEGAIFWCLNPRSSGIEAGEWALLNYQDQPSDRMIEANNIIRTIHANESFFRSIKVVESGISILYNRESLWIEKKLQIPGTSYEGRQIGGVMKSALAYFEAVTEMGHQANFQEMGEYDFAKDNFTGKTIILAHQVSIPSRYWPLLERFVANGGKMIVEGLTGYYDENGYCLLRNFPLQNLFGGVIREFKLIENLFLFSFSEIILPAHLWQGTILPITAIPEAHTHDQVLAVRNKYGKGEVLWIPSLIGLGARITGDYEPLTQLLSKEICTHHSLLSFCKHQPSVMMKTIRSADAFITLIINKSGKKREIGIQLHQPLKNTQLLFANKGGSFREDHFIIEAEESILLKWENISL